MKISLPFPLYFGILLAWGLLITPTGQATSLHLTPKSQLNVPVSKNAPSALSSHQPAYPPLNPSSVQPMSTRQIAFNALKQGQIRQAHVLLETWVEEHPDDLEATFQVAKSSYQLGHIELMHRYIEQLQTLSPQSMWTKKALAWAETTPQWKVPVAVQAQNKALFSFLASIAEETPTPVNVAPVERKLPTQEASLEAKTPRSPVASPMDPSPRSTTNAPSTDTPTTSLPELKEGLIAPSEASPAVSAKAAAEAPPIATASQRSPSTTTTPNTGEIPPLTQAQITQNFQMLQQLMMMQMMNNNNSNGTAMNMNNPLSMLPMMMPQGQGTNPANGNTQAFSQMMQNSLLNNMNGLFNTNTPNNNDSGFGF
ncbi:MAG: hypothetical protein HEQ32_09485 [Vampirovibrio sp.]